MENPEQFLNPEKNKGGENDKPVSQTAQLVMRVGNRAVVVMPVEEYHRITHPFNSFSQFLLASPLFGSELRLSRDTSSGREVTLEL